MSELQEIENMIGLPEGETLEFKAVLPPARSLAQMMAAFANASGGTIILGIRDQQGDIQVTGLSEDFHANSVTHRAIDLLTPKPSVTYEHVNVQEKKLYVIKIATSAAPVSLEGKIYRRNGVAIILTNPEQRVASTIGLGIITKASDQLTIYKTSATGAKLKFIDHYTGVLNLMNDLSRLLYPQGAGLPTDNAEGKILMRILFSSCADNFEIYLTDILYEIYLAKPSTLKSAQQVTVKEVLDCADMQEFVLFLAKKKIAKLQRGSVRGFVSDNAQVKELDVLDEVEQDKIEKILQIRHLYAHRNGIVDEKFLKFFPGQYNLNDEHQLCVDSLMGYFSYLALTVDKIDRAAVDKFQLATL